MHGESLYASAIAAGIPDGIVAVFAAHPYAIIFLSLLVGGGIILFPAFYLSLSGALSASSIIWVMVGAAIVNDSFWYAVGRGMLPRFIERRFIESRSDKVRRLSRVVRGRELVVLFYSKFVYGTRIAAQILCGARKVSLPPFQLVGAFAVLILGCVYYGVVRIAARSAESLTDARVKLAVVLFATALAMGTLHYLAYRIGKKRFGE
ncbi:MAG TPA: hypothetical protein VFS75_02920 [Candidatus Paceibacterota bacterium]|nr:hypothetical protein [Candidatus Paceibacterota bacterium]